MPRLRAHHPAAGAVPPPTPRGWAGPELPGDAAVREVRPAPAAEPAGGAVRPRGGGPQPLDPRRPGRRGRRGACPAPCADRGPCHGGLSAAWRRHHRAGAREGQDEDGAPVGLRARRPPLRGAGAISRALPLLARPAGRAPAAAPQGLERRAPGRRLRRLRGTLRRGPLTPDPSSRRCAGPTPGGSSTSWPTSPRARGADPGRPRSRPSRSRRCGASTSSSTSNAPPMAQTPPPAWLRGARRLRPSSPILSAGCVSPSAPACRATPPSQRPWTTMLKRWKRLRAASSTTAASA